jgi:hypothetical protein
MRGLTLAILGTMWLAACGGGNDCTCDECETAIDLCEGDAACEDAAVALCGGDTAAE